MRAMVKMDAGTKANVVSAVSAFGKLPGSTPVNVLRYRRAKTNAIPPVAVTSAAVHIAHDPSAQFLLQRRIRPAPHPMDKGEGAYTEERKDKNGVKYYWEHDAEHDRKGIQEQENNNNRNKVPNSPGSFQVRLQSAGT